jgi:hypothetical protein
MTLQAYQERYAAIRARVQAYEASVYNRARNAAHAAGVDLGCALHNCILAGKEGKPWGEVDYSLARRAQWLMEVKRDAARNAVAPMLDRWFRAMIDATR